MAAKMKSNLDAVTNVFEGQQEHWISSKAVHDMLPTLQRQDVYASVSELARSGVLEKRKLSTGAGYEYKILPEDKREAKHAEVRREQRAKLLAPYSAPRESTSTHELTLDSADRNVDPNTVAPTNTDVAEQQASSDGARQDGETNQLSLLDESAADVPVTVVPEGVRGRAPRVVWTPEEKYAIAKEVARLQKAQPHLSIMSAVRLAQEVLPEKRRRLVQIQTRHHIPWIDDLLAQARTEVDSEVDTESQKVQQQVTPQPADPAQSEPAETSTTTNESRQAGMLTQLGDLAQQAVMLAQHPEFASTSQLLDILMQRIGQTFKSMLLDVLSSDEMKAILMDVRSPTSAEQSAAAVLTPVRPGSASAHAQTFSTGGPAPLSALQATEADVQPVVTRQRQPETAKAAAKQTAPRLKRVLVMGLIPNQIQEVANEFKGALDMRFWRTDQSANLLKSLSKQVDQTVIMTDFIAHSHEGLIKNSGVPYVRQPGGITKLKDTLTHIYANDDM